MKRKNTEEIKHSNSLFWKVKYNNKKEWYVDD